MRSLSIINIQPKNWEICVSDTIFGLREGAHKRVALKKGDLCLVRRLGKEKGVHAIWEFQSEEPVTQNSIVPWKDANYTAIFHCKELIRFQSPFNEEFKRKKAHSYWSEKVGLASIFLAGSILRVLLLADTSNPLLKKKGWNWKLRLMVELALRLFSPKLRGIRRIHCWPRVIG